MFAFFYCGIFSAIEQCKSLRWERRAHEKQFSTFQFRWCFCRSENNEMLKIGRFKLYLGVSYSFVTLRVTRDNCTFSKRIAVFNGNAGLSLLQCSKIVLMYWHCPHWLCIWWNLHISHSMLLMVYNLTVHWYFREASSSGYMDSIL